MSAALGSTGLYLDDSSSSSAQRMFRGDCIQRSGQHQSLRTHMQPQDQPSSCCKRLSGSARFTTEIAAVQPNSPLKDLASKSNTAKYSGLPD